MIKQIACNKGSRYSINFVDDQNKLVGWDDNYQCCEDFGWVFHNFASDEEADRFENTGDKEDIPDNLSGIDNPDLSQAYFADEQPLATSGKFKIEGCKECNWLILYNFHNGFYYHGFMYKEKDKEIFRGKL